MIALEVLDEVSAPLNGGRREEAAALAVPHLGVDPALAELEGMVLRTARDSVMRFALDEQYRQHAPRTFHDVDEVPVLRERGQVTHNSAPAG